ncbi:MAG: UDP-N-acetylmuramoyl-L-alanine--D-glutamate ligase [Lachnospiraceae bacterium]
MLETIQNIVKDKKIVILGFGREGKSTLSLILRAGGYDRIAIADQNPVTLPEDILEKYHIKADEIVLECGGNYQKNLDAYDVIFKSPGIVLEKDPKELSAKLLSQTEVFFSRYRNQMIGITGTKGKSTTTTLIYHILKNAGRNVILAGNIGIPAFDILDQIREDSIIVFEMSSHMLEYMTVAPKTAVYLNVHEEHLDHYGSMEKYVAAKENIYRNQQPGDVLYVNELILPQKDACRSEIISVGYGKNAMIRIRGNEIYLMDPKSGYGDAALPYVIPTEDIHLLGEHNYYNIAVALGVLSRFGIGIEEFTKGLCSYETLPHRLQYIGTVGGVKYYDDSISTICDTAIQALNSVKDASTILIGGMDRGIDYRDLIQFLSDHSIEHIILMATTGKRIYEEINTSFPEFEKKERLHPVDTLEEAVDLAKKITPSGRSCVMSPAAASYGIFKNFEERGDVFKKLVLGSSD